jgi:hypothetical protein
MRNAATLAGIVKAELREEPLCSATVSMHELLRFDRIKEGQCSINYDCGSGTFDASVTRLDKIPSNGQQMGLTCIGICSGNDAGSQMLNEQLLLYLDSDECPEIRNHGGIDRLCSRMNIKRREFERQASDKFDFVKLEFPSHRDKHLLAISDVNADVNSLTIHLPHELIEKWYKIWVAKAVRLIQKHIKGVTKWAAKGPDGTIHLDYACVVFSRGGYECKLLEEESKRAINEFIPGCYVHRTKEQIPCAKGALLHHYFQRHTLPSSMHFFLARADCNSKDEEVPDRLKCIMRYKDGEFFGQELCPMKFLIEIGQSNQQPRLHFDLFWSENHMEDYAPLGDSDGNLIRGIRRFPLAWADIDDLEAKGFQKIIRKGEKPHFIVDAWVEMSYANNKLILTVHIMKPKYKLPWKAGGGKRLARRGRKSYVGTPKTGAQLNQADIFKTFPPVEVWDKDSSHFITQSVGTCISRGDAIDEDDED